jgi:hypothetical protein
MLSVYARDAPSDRPALQSTNPRPRSALDPRDGLWRTGPPDDPRRGMPGRRRRGSQSACRSPQSLPSTPGSCLAFIYFWILLREGIDDRISRRSASGYGSVSCRNKARHHKPGDKRGSHGGPPVLGATDEPSSHDEGSSRYRTNPEQQLRGRYRTGQPPGGDGRHRGARGTPGCKPERGRSPSRGTSGRGL